MSLLRFDEPMSVPSLLSFELHHPSKTPTPSDMHWFLLHSLVNVGFYCVAASASVTVANFSNPVCRPSLNSVTYKTGLKSHRCTDISDITTSGPLFFFFFWASLTIRRDSKKRTGDNRGAGGLCGADDNDIRETKGNRGRGIFFFF